VRSTDLVPQMSSLNDMSAELHKVPELAALGPVYSSTTPLELTEAETEYVVSCVKHMMASHIVLEFTITNTISDQLLLDTCVSLEPVDSAETYDVVASVTAPVLRCGSS